MRMAECAVPYSGIRARLGGCWGGAHTRRLGVCRCRANDDGAQRWVRCVSNYERGEQAPPPPGGSFMCMRAAVGYVHGPAPHAVQGPGEFDKTNVPVQLRNRCESAMRGLWYSSQIEGGVAPCFLIFVRRVHSQTFEGGLGAPRFLASGWFIGIRVDHVRSASHPGTRYKLAGAASRRRGRMCSRRMLAPVFINAPCMIDGCHKDWMVVRVRFHARTFISSL